MSYVYRVWMAIRKTHTRDWSLKIHGGKHEGAAAMACRTRIHTEVSMWKGQETLSTFLDCSKCYERIEQYVVVQRAICSGFPITIGNLNASIYSGSGCTGLSRNLPKGAMDSSRGALSPKTC